MWTALNRAKILRPATPPSPGQRKHTHVRVALHCALILRLVPTCAARRAPAVLAWRLTRSDICTLSDSTPGRRQEMAFEDSSTLALKMVPKRSVAALRDWRESPHKSAHERTIEHGKPERIPHPVCLPQRDSSVCRSPYSGGLPVVPLRTPHTARHPRRENHSTAGARWYRTAGMRK